MCTYLKNMAGFTHNQLKNKSFDEVQKAFDKTMSWIDLFVLMDSEVMKDRAEGSETRAEGSSKRAWQDLQQESTKKNEVFGYIILLKIKLLIKKLEDSEVQKLRLLVEVTTAQEVQEKYSK
ncbi:hypothetical protein Tco_1188069 [Tanacetum coccineum]